MKKLVVALAGVAILAVVVALLALGIGARGVQSQSVTPCSLLGASFGGTLFDVNPTSGAASNPRSTGIASLAGIAFDASGATLYGVSASLSGGSTLYTINPTTGASTVVGSTGLEQLVEGDLDFDPTTPGGDPYGMYGFLITLLRLAASDGFATSVGSMSGSVDPSAMAFDSAGVLYVFDGTGGVLLTVNKSNGQTLTTTPLSDSSLGSVAGMDFDPATGELYVANGFPVQGVTPKLYTLNPSTGVLNPIGSLGLASGLAGLEFVQPCVVPIGVGGTVELLDQADSPADGSDAAAAAEGSGSSAPLYGALAVVAGALAVVAAAGWYVRRRWLR